jgi:SAM-dependent methyltransferase
LVGTLQMALNSKISDIDDFKRLVLKYDNNIEVYIYRLNESVFTIWQNGMAEDIPESEIYDSIENFTQQGFHSIVCECYSGDVNIEIPSGKNKKLKITYSKPSIKAEADDEGHLISLDEVSKLLETIEMINPDGNIKENMKRKYVQIDNFIKHVQPLLDKSSQNKKVFILDCGSGKSYLSFVMNYYLHEKLRRNCHFFCIDTNADLIDKCQRVAKELGFGNMEFHVSMIKDFQPTEKVDIVCSLHACDTATDEAIAKGILLESPFILNVPCCQHEVINQLAEHPLKAITRHGLFKARFADLLTDALRTLILELAGYKVTVTEYVSAIHTPKNTLIQAEKIQSRNKMALEQYLELKAVFGGISIELERMLPELFRQV